MQVIWTVTTWVQSKNILGEKDSVSNASCQALPICVLQSVGSETAQAPAGLSLGENCRILVSEPADALLLDVAQ